MVDSPNISWHHLKFPLIWMPTKNNAPSSLEKGWRDWHDVFHDGPFNLIQFFQLRGQVHHQSEYAGEAVSGVWSDARFFLGPSGTFRTFKEGPIWEMRFFCETRPWNQQGVLRLARFIMRKNTSTSENKAAKIYRTNAKNYPNPSTFADSNELQPHLLHLSPNVSVDLENCHWPTWARGSCQCIHHHTNHGGNSRDP